MIEFFNLIGRMFESGFTWAAIVSALLALEKYYDKRQTRKMLYLIAKKVGVEWDTPQEELRKMVLLNYNRFYSLSQVATIRRKTVMNKLKSRKFWMAILAVVLPVINEQFNIGLDNSTVIAAIGGLVAFILGEAHIDAKKAAEIKPPAEPDDQNYSH